MSRWLPVLIASARRWPRSLCYVAGMMTGLIVFAAMSRYWVTASMCVIMLMAVAVIASRAGK